MYIRWRLMLRQTHTTAFVVTNSHIRGMLESADLTFTTLSVAVNYKSLHAVWYNLVKVSSSFKRPPTVLSKGSCYRHLIAESIHR